MFPLWRKKIILWYSWTCIWVFQDFFFRRFQSKDLSIIHQCIGKDWTKANAWIFKLILQGERLKFHNWDTSFLLLHFKLCNEIFCQNRKYISKFFIRTQARPCLEVQNIQKIIGNINAKTWIIWPHCEVSANINFLKVIFGNVWRQFSLLWNQNVHFELRLKASPIGP